LLGAPGSGKTLLVRRIKALCNIRSHCLTRVAGGGVPAAARWAARRHEWGRACVPVCEFMRV
jgi:hypothetical protein